MLSPSVSVNAVSRRSENGAPMQRIELRCACGECRLPFAIIENGMLVIQSRHNGETHHNVIPLLVALEWGHLEKR